MYDRSAIDRYFYIWKCIANSRLFIVHYQSGVSFLFAIHSFKNSYENLLKLATVCLVDKNFDEMFRFFEILILQQNYLLEETDYYDIKLDLVKHRFCFFPSHFIGSAFAFTLIH